MTRDDQFIGQLEDYLDEYEGSTPLPDVVRDAVRAQLPTAKQMGSLLGPMRYLNMKTPSTARRYLQVGLAAAAAVVIAVVGYQFLGNSNTGGPGATETPEASVLAVDELALRPHPLSVRNRTRSVDVTVTYTIAAPGWFRDYTEEGTLIKGNSGGDSPDGVGMIWPVVGPLYVFGDPCQWRTTKSDTPATTVDEFVAAVAAHASRNPSAPVDVTVGGYAGKSITLHMPKYNNPDTAFSDCDRRLFASWTIEAGIGPCRCHQGPGQIDTLWVVDVNGELLVIDAWYYPATPADHVDELRAIIDSITFE